VNSIQQGKGVELRFANSTGSRSAILQAAQRTSAPV
jgi:hypothetical protein